MSNLEDLGRGAAGHGFVVDAGDAIRAREVRGERLLLWVILLFVVSFLVWAYFAVLEEVVRGSGKVIPSSQVQVVQNLEGGIVESIGVCRGNVIRAKHVGTDIVAGLRNIVGGEVTEYTKMISEARQQAYDRMVRHAEQLGANAIVGMRFTTSTVSPGAAEILAFGTAVRLR